MVFLGYLLGNKFLYNQAQIIIFYCILVIYICAESQATLGQ